MLFGNHYQWGSLSQGLVFICTRVSYKISRQERPTRVACESVPRVFYECVPQKCPLQECPATFSDKSVKQECPTRVSRKSVQGFSPKVFHKTVPRECYTNKMSQKSVGPV